MLARTSGFTVVELLVVVAVVALLVAVLVPGLNRAREAAKVAAVLGELRNISVALDAYGLEHKGELPPARTFCDNRRNQTCPLPRELAEGGYLPAGPGGPGFYCNMPDRFHPTATYRYVKVGWGFHNGAPVPKGFWVPDSFPNDPPNAHDSGRFYDNVLMPTDEDGKVIASPVLWAVWSVGPRYVESEANIYAPVARESWYHGYGSRGVIACIRTAEGNNIFSR